MSFAFTLPLWLLVLLSIVGMFALGALCFFAFLGWQCVQVFSKGVWR